MTTGTDIRSRIQKKRGAKSIKATAKEIGISHTTLARIERGDFVMMDTYQKVSNWLNAETNKASKPKASKPKASKPKATLHGYEVNVGDKVWHCRYGWGTVVDTDYKGRAIATSFRSGCLYTYFSDGRWAKEDLTPSIFWKEQTVDLTKPPAPKPKWCWVFGRKNKASECLYELLTEEEAESYRLKHAYDWKFCIEPTKTEDEL